MSEEHRRTRNERILKQLDERGLNIAAVVTGKQDDAPEMQVMSFDHDGFIDRIETKIHSTVELHATDNESKGGMFYLFGVGFKNENS